MNDKSAAAEPHSPPSGEARNHHELARDIGETRGELRLLKWVCGVAFFALLGAMGALYEHQKELGRNIQKVRENVAMIDERTIHMGKRTGRIRQPTGKRGGLAPRAGRKNRLQSLNRRRNGRSRGAPPAPAAGSECPGVSGKVRRPGCP